MKLLIGILNTITNWAVKRLSRRIRIDLWYELEMNNKIECEVKYDFNNTEEVCLDIIVNEELSYDDELKVYEIVGLVNDEYPMVSIEAMIYSREQYNQKMGIK